MRRTGRSRGREGSEERAGIAGGDRSSGTSEWSMHSGSVEAAALRAADEKDSSIQAGGFSPRRGAGIRARRSSASSSQARLSVVLLRVRFDGAPLRGVDFGCKSHSEEERPKVRSIGREQLFVCVESKFSTDFGTTAKVAS